MSETLESTQITTPRIKVGTTELSLLLYLGHIILNFLATPLIKYYYVAEVIFFLFLALKQNINKLFIPILIFLFIEGQGRVIWHYHPLSRIIFDLTLSVILLKNVISTKSLFNFQKVPKFFALLIFGHFLWYIVQIFNYSNAGVIGVISASKIYIFPILLFFLFLDFDLHESKDKIKKIQIYSAIIITIQLFLIFFQMGVGEENLLAMSEYYTRPLEGIFIGPAYRPFGTSYLPGVISSHLAYSTGFMLLATFTKQIRNTLRIILLAFMVIANVILQVRSALVKQLIIIFVHNLNFLVGKKNKVKILSAFSVFIFSIFLGVTNIEKAQNLFPNIDLRYTISRIQNISTVQSFTSNRASVGTFWDALTTKLSKTPLGLGPGRTGAASSIVIKNIHNDPLYGQKYSWTHDNLFISLAIDLGVGMIFYASLILLLPLFLVSRTIKAIRTKKDFRILSISTASTVAILIGNWGAIGIPYNPESFFFWFWLAIGINESYKLEKELEKESLFVEESNA